MKGQSPDVNWEFDFEPLTGSDRWHGAQLAVLMDIRRETKKLNTLLHCQNFIAIPTILRAIKTNTTKHERAKSSRSRKRR